MATINRSIIFNCIIVKTCKVNENLWRKNKVDQLEYKFSYSLTKEFNKIFIISCSLQKLLCFSIKYIRLMSLGLVKVYEKQKFTTVMYKVYFFLVHNQEN